MSETPIFDALVDQTWPLLVIEPVVFAPLRFTPLGYSWNGENYYFGERT